MATTVRRIYRLALRRCGTWVAFVATAGMVGAQPGQVISATALFSPELLSGPHHTVEGRVEVSDYMAHVRINSEYGVFDAPSAELARWRIGELTAIAHLQEIASGKAFADAMARSLQTKADVATKVVTDPGGTASALGRSASNLFGRGKRGVEDATAEDQEGETSSGDAVAQTGKDLIGYSAARRQFAQSAGADPYTTNPVLQSEMDRLANAAVAGGMTTSLALPTIPGLSQLASVGALAYGLSAEDLRTRNDKALQAMGVESADSRGLLTNPAYSPTVATVLVTGLEALSGMSDRAALVRMARQAGTEVEARRYAQSVQLLKLANDSLRPLVRATTYRSALAAVDQAGVLIVAAPVDYLTWDADLEEAAAAAPAGAAGSRELWITGKIQPRALHELDVRGWTVREGIHLGS